MNDKFSAELIRRLLVRELREREHWSLRIVQRVDEWFESHSATDEEMRNLALQLFPRLGRYLTANARPPKGFVIDLLVPPDRADDMLLALDDAFEKRWLPKYGARKARRIFITQSIGSVLGFWIDWLMKRIKFLKLFSGSGAQ